MLNIFILISSHPKVCFIYIVIVKGIVIGLVYRFIWKLTPNHSFNYYNRKKYKEHCEILVLTQNVLMWVYNLSTYFFSHILVCLLWRRYGVNWWLCIVHVNILQFYSWQFEVTHWMATCILLSPYADFKVFCVVD